MSESPMNAKELVIKYFETCDRKDFKSARNYVSDNVSYTSPIGSFDKAEPYFKYFEHVDLPDEMVLMMQNASFEEIIKLIDFSTAKKTIR